jgi:hypothetical protein
MLQSHGKFLLGKVNLKGQLMSSFNRAASLYSTSFERHVDQHPFAAYMPASNLAIVPEPILNRIPKVATLFRSDGNDVLL